jgi:DNA primase
LKRLKAFFFSEGRTCQKSEEIILRRKNEQETKLIKERQSELIQEIKDKNDIVSVVSEYVSLKRSGRSLVGLCPFHSEKTPSFGVNQVKQFFYCFGCGTGGDVISFVMKLENLDFVGAARWLADRAGIPWPEIQPASEDDHLREEFYKINKLAAAFFSHCLTKTEPGNRARAYLKQRGINEPSWQQFNLGYAPAVWHSFTEVLRRKGVPLEQAESLGLIGFGENGYYDRFRDRLIFPITDPKGNVIGFGGRVFDNSQPKYLNSPETMLFHKGHFLYGLHLAKESIRKKNQAMIVEGYLDVIQAHQAGFMQTVASLGTALTKEQAKTIKRYAQEVVLAYDADTAGQNATVRGMEILQEAELKVKILHLPAGDDPDSFIKLKGAAEFENLLGKASNLTEFKISRAIGQYDLNTSEGKVLAVKSVLPQITALDSNISREFYIRQLAREIGISEAAIFAELQEWQKKNIKNASVLDRKNSNSYTKETSEKIGIAIGETGIEKLSPLQRAVFKAEKELLQSALQEYNKFERIKEELKAEEFSFKIWRDLFLQIKQVGLSSNDDFNLILEQINGSYREVAATLIAEQEVKNYCSDFEGSINRLKMFRLQEKVLLLTSEITTGRDQGGQALSEADLKIKVAEFTELKRKLQKEYPNFLAGIS